jgi:hypothetical protein
MLCSWRRDGRRHERGKNGVVMDKRTIARRFLAADEQEPADFWNCDNENCAASHTPVRLVTDNGECERVATARCYCGGTLRAA